MFIFVFTLTFLPSLQWLFLVLASPLQYFLKSSKMRPINNPLKTSSSAFLNSPTRKLLLSKSPKSNIPTPRSRLQLSQKSINLPNLSKKPVMQEETKEFLLHIQSDQLFADLNLFHVKAKLKRFQNSLIDEKKDLFVLSKIQEFYMQYNEHFNQIYAKARSVTWLIISNAVNSREIWQEFNSTYDPIKFIFLKNIQEAINYFNFGHYPKETETKKLSQFSKIVNFESYQNNFAYIHEYSLQQNDYFADKSGQLWLISKEQLKKIRGNEYSIYYIGQQSFIDDGIQLDRLNQQIVIFILVTQNYSACLHHSIKQIQSNMKVDGIKQAIFQSKSQRYIQKIIKHYLNQQLILNIIGFPEEIRNIFYQHSKYVITCDQIGPLDTAYIYKIYPDVQQTVENPFQEVLQLKSKDIQKQIKRVSQAYMKLITLKKQYRKSINRFNAYNIISFRLGVKEKRQIQDLICKNIEQIKNLKCIQELTNKDQPIIIVGQLFDRQIQSFTNYPNISFLNIKGYEHNRISYYEKFLTMFTRDTNQSRIIFNQTIVTNFSEQISQLQTNQTHLYCFRKIDTFTDFLSQIGLKSSHLIVMKMNDYTEERQAKLKEAQLMKESKFQVYLLYGNDFICRSQGTYTFLKKEQIILKIKDILNERRKIHNKWNQQYTQNMENGYLSLLDYQVKSDILCYSAEENHYGQFLSTPNLANYFPMHKKEVIICMPKSIPHHSLLDRSINPYTLLIYTSFDQVLQLTKYELEGIYIVVIGPELQATSEKMIFAQKQQCQYITVLEPTQKNYRGIIDNLIDRFELGKKIGSINKKISKTPFILLYNHLDQKQVKVMGMMHSLFKNSKIIAMSKKQFKNIKKLYGISQCIQIYELGKAEISYAKRLKTVVDIFKIYMSPNIASHDFSGQSLRFSIKQMFLRAFFQSQKKRRVGKLSQSRRYRSKSPKGTNMLQKQAFLWQAGIVFFQSTKLNKLMKKQKFNTSNQLISLALFHLGKGSQIIVVIGEEEFFQIKNYVEVYDNELIWVVLSEDKKKYIIRQKNIVFCKQEQLEATLNNIIVNYRNWKQICFKIKSQNYAKQSQQYFDNINAYNSNKKLIVKVHSIFGQNQQKESQQLNQFNILLLQNQKYIYMKSLKSKLIFTNKSYLQQYSQSDQIPSLNTNDSHLELQNRIHFVCNHRNLRFLEQTLNLIKEFNFIIILYMHISQLISYSIQGKSIFIIQREQAKIKCENAIFIESSDTANNFCLKLRVFIEAIRKIN